MRLAALFSDHVVLQRDRPLRVWGAAAPGGTVAVALAGRSASTRAGADGRWSVELDPLPAGGPHQLQAEGDGVTVTVHDVLIGEVWVCSGQSNMAWPLEMSQGGAAAIAAADLARLRLFVVPRRGGARPAADIDAGWAVSSPRNVGDFSAVAYHFGRHLLQRLDVPVGLIVAAWGGTPGEAWISAGGLDAHPLLAPHADQVAAVLAQDPQRIEAAYQELRRRFLAGLPQDPGNRGLAEGWARPDYDDSAWDGMALPAYWSERHPTNGVFWFRLAVDLPAAWAGQELQLDLGAADKSDDTYFNGERIGGLAWADDRDSWSTTRRYRVPAGLARAGRNLIAVRVLSNYSGGGLTGPATAMLLRGPAERSDPPLPLAGTWRYRIERDFGRVTGHVEPVPPHGERLPTTLFNGMIAPLLPFPIRGAIWYQGESNVGDAARYRELFPALIRDWRRHWGQGDFPFCFVQLANHGKPAVRESDDSRWAELREAQALARSLPATAMAVAIDIGDPADIHPRDKTEVGRRLALAALGQAYGVDVAWRGPAYRALQVEGAAVRIAFDHAEGLTARGGKVLGFAVAGADRAFHAADARIEGDTVVAASESVALPVAVRYGWADAPVCTLWNAAGLPAEPFRSDAWPVGPGPA